MRTLTALGLTIALTFGGSSYASPQPPESDSTPPAVVEDRNSDGAYLVATMALLGLAGLAGITRRDYVRAHRRNRRRSEPIEPTPPTTSAVVSPVERILERGQAMHGS